MSIGLSCIALFAACPVVLKDISILFCGNSHTWTNDLPGMVKSLLEADKDKYRVHTYFVSGGFLNDIWSSGQAKKALDTRRHHFVVLQGARLSSSHKYEYDNSGAVSLAKHALSKGGRVLWFVEWPRRGWDESAFQLGHYRKIAKDAGGGELVSICRAWDLARKGMPKLDMWQSDGNHAKLEGTYLTALVFANWMSNGRSSLGWSPRGIDAKLAGYLKQTARKIKRPGPAPS